MKAGGQKIVPNLIQQQFVIADCCLADCESVLRIQYWGSVPVFLWVVHIRCSTCGRHSFGPRCVAVQIGTGSAAGIVNQQRVVIGTGYGFLINK